jgi:hypothetical protein
VQVNKELLENLGVVALQRERLDGNDFAHINQPAQDSIAECKASLLCGQAKKLGTARLVEGAHTTDGEIFVVALHRKM